MISRHFKTTLLLGLSLAMGLVAAGQCWAQEANDLIGRWDVTVTDGDTEYPSWFEVSKSGHSTLVGRYVGQFGSARPIAEITFEDGEMRFEVPKQWEGRKDKVVYEGKLKGDVIEGETTNDAGKTIHWRAVPAPVLEDPASTSEGETIALFNGNDLDGWKPRFEGRPNGWEVIDGLLTNKNPGNDLITTQKFNDFKLLAEFRYPKGSNSGIYLRGRYEVQIEDNHGMPAESHLIGGVYGFLTPAYNAGKEAGQWQTYDITLIGRRITVVLNGTRVIDQQIIPGITGGALDSDEGSAGPLMIQGDHGPVEFRKLELTPILSK